MLEGWTPDCPLAASWLSNALGVSHSFGRHLGDDGDDGGDDGGDDSDDGYDDGDDGGLMYGEKINHLCSKESTWNMTP